MAYVSQCLRGFLFSFSIMANLQLPAAQVPYRYERDQVRVVAKKKWSDPWKLVSYLQPISATVCAAPSLPQAKLSYDAGRMKREDTTEFALYSPQDLIDQFTRIEIVRLGWHTDPFETPIPLWTGLVASDGRAPGGTEDGNNVADQHLTAYGLEYLLDRRDIQTSFVLDESSEQPSAFAIDRCLVFNEQFNRGFSEKGNRSLVRIPAESESESEEASTTGPYVFDRFHDDEDGGKQLWSVRDIVEHLLHFHAPPSVRWVLRGPDDVLECLGKIYPGPVNVTGKTVRQVLTDLIDRRSGLGWFVHTATIPANEFDEESQAEEVAEIIVFTHLNQPVRVDDTAVVPANMNTVEIPLDQFRQLIDEVEQEIDAAQRYGKIVVLGGHVVTCASWSFTDGTLKIGWTEDEETRYKQAGGAADAQLADAERNRDVYRRVYSLFLIPPEWNGLCGNGEGKEKKVAVPDVNPKTGMLMQNLPPKARKWGYRFSNRLPLEKAKPDVEFSEINYNPEYRDIFAVVKDKTKEGADTWAILDGSPDAACATVRVVPAANNFGFDVVATPNHLIAKNHFEGKDAETSEEGEADSKKHPRYDYKDMIITAAFETDQRLKVEMLIPNGDPDRVLTIECDDLELWHVVNGTVIDVEAGKLKRHTADAVVRDDSDRARMVLSMAGAWFGQVRTPLSFKADYLTYYQLGQYVTRTTSAAGPTPVNCVITQFGIDFIENATTVQTASGELDFTLAGRKKRKGLKK